MHENDRIETETDSCTKNENTENNSSEIKFHTTNWEKNVALKMY